MATKLGRDLKRFDGVVLLGEDRQIASIEDVSHPTYPPGSRLARFFDGDPFVFEPDYAYEVW